MRLPKIEIRIEQDPYSGRANIGLVAHDECLLQLFPLIEKTMYLLKFYGGWASSVSGYEVDCCAKQVMNDLIISGYLFEQPKGWFFDVVAFVQDALGITDYKKNRTIERPISNERRFSMPSVYTGAGTTQWDRHTLAKCLIRDGKLCDQLKACNADTIEVLQHKLNDTKFDSAVEEYRNEMITDIARI